MGEFAILGALLLGLQHGYTSIVAPAPNDLAAPAMPSLAAQQATAHVNALVEQINDVSFLAHGQANEGAAPVTLPKSFANETAPVPAEFAFSLSQPELIASAKTANPITAHSAQSRSLAIWQLNSTFAFSAFSEGDQDNPDKVLATAEKKFVIMLDPGHGGSDPGSIGHNGLEEKALTLDIAKRAERILSKNKGISVMLTRDDDTGMSRKNRVQKVKRSNADMVVSLHLNHLPQTDVNLVETFYAAPHNILESLEKQRQHGLVKATAAHNHDFAFTQGSKQLASLMQRRVFEEVIESNPDTDNAGVKEDTLYILTRSFTPGVLIELSCLSNIQEAERLNDDAYRERLAQALANGINDYLKTPAAKRQFGPEV